MSRRLIAGLVCLVMLGALLIPIASSSAQVEWSALVTAVRDGNGDLKVIAWEIGSGGTLTQRGEATAGPISEIAVAEVYRGTFVTAVINNEGELQVIAWDINPDNGSVNRLGDARAGAVSAVSVAPLKRRKVATAVINSYGNLQVIIWEITESGDVRRLSDANAGVASEVSAVDLREIEHLATAVINSYGQLEIITWAVSFDGILTRKDSVWDENGDMLSSAPIYGQTLGWPSGMGTALRDSDGNLRVIAWKILRDGTIERQGEESAGPVRAIAATYSSGYFENQGIATSLVNNSGNLQVIHWHVTDDGQVIRRGEGRAGPISIVSASFNGYIATAVRSDNGDLKIIMWSVDNDGQITRATEASAGQVSRIATVFLVVGQSFE
jgi:hypothetical protein